MKKAEKIAYLTLTIICLSLFFWGAIEAINAESPKQYEVHWEHGTIRLNLDCTHDLQFKRVNTLVQEHSREMPVKCEIIEVEETPTEEPTPEPTEEPLPTFYMLATAYSSDPAENGGYGAVDCVHGDTLPWDAIAANLRQLPYGTRVYIEGVGEKKVVDTASRATITKMETMAEKRGCDGWIDIYYGDNKQGALDWGIRYVKVTVLEWGTGR